MKNILNFFILLSFSTQAQEIDESKCHPVVNDMVMGSCVGYKGMGFGDLNADGMPEIIIKAGDFITQFWYMLQYDSVTNDYKQIWASQLFESPERLDYLTILPTGNQGKPQVIIATGQNLLIYEDIPARQADKIFTGLSSVLNIEYADADNDKINEWIVSDFSSTVLIDPITKQIKQQMSEGGVCKIGNVNGDTLNEIVFATGKILQLKDLVLKTEWIFDSNGSVLDLLEIADLTGDSVMEIVHAKAWDLISVFSGVTQTLKYKITTAHDIRALDVKDITGDGKCELFYGDGQWGKIHAHKSSGQLLWSIANPHYGVSALIVEDVNRDSDWEILWSGGCINTSSDVLLVYDAITRVREWKGIHLDGPFRAIDVGDLDNNGDQEIIAISTASNNHDSDGRVSIYDADTYKLIYRKDTNLFDGLVYEYGINAAAIGDIDDDGLNEFIVGTDRQYDGIIWVYSFTGSSVQLKAKYLFPAEPMVTDLLIDDVDEDGNTEIIAGFKSGTILVLDGKTGSIEWQSPSLSYPIYELKTGNVNDDLKKEIIASARDIYVFDGITHQMTQTYVAECLGFDLHAPDPSGKSLIAVGKSSGNIGIYDGTNLGGNAIATISCSTNAPVTAVAVKQIEPGKHAYVYTSNGRLYIQNDVGNLLYYDSTYRGKGLGDQNALMVFNDSNLLIGSGYSVLVYDHSCLINALGISTELSHYPVSAYPNPSSGMFRFASQKRIDRIQIYDISGRLMKELKTLAEPVVDCQDLPMGVYIAKIFMDKSVSVIKLLISK